ncbi:dienelactone hydrolase family protein [Amycolatopsis sp. NPDC049688]|uniref:dienelactone hydrolase family protein n=1 Tax=Amycolatopsis sp. NPDC049688 TaxID=3154733 RepID=UPI0034451672
MLDVTTEWITLGTADGPMRVHCARPEAPPGRAVVVLQEAFGVNDHVRDLAHRFAERGYLALAPELFHRTGSAVIPYDDHDQAVALIGELGVREITTDVGAVLRHLEDGEGLAVDRTAVVGFCFGGRAAFTAATATPGLGAAVVFYGPGIAAGPHAVLDRAEAITAPLLLHVGADDPTIPEAHVAAIDSALAESGVDFAQHVYDGAGHAFACDARPHMYSADAAETAWARTYSFLEDHLPADRAGATVVRERLDVFPFTAPARVLHRREDLLLQRPDGGPFRIGAGLTPLEAVRYDTAFAPEKLEPPRGVYEGARLRLEWQIMNFRQPFYHRNADVDELSYQIAGERTLMTEHGTVELRAGDFSRIPRGVAHDNYGREESHLLFYLPAPVEELAAPVRSADFLLPPFPGWQAEPKNEVLTECLGGPEHDVAYSAVDERLLLAQAGAEPDRITVLRADDTASGTTWLYRSAEVMIGRTRAERSAGSEYVRHLDVDEIQYQIDGTRTLVTQRGALRLEPGDFVRIPVGVAFTSLHDEPSTHLTLVSTQPVPQVAPTAKKAEPVTAGDLRRLRQR